MQETMAQERTRLLANELRWLMRLRWLGGGAILAFGVLDQVALRWYGTGAWLMVLGAGVLAYNVALWWGRGVGSAPSHRALAVLASVQIHLDLATLTLVALVTGGLSSPVLIFFVFHMVFAGLLQPRARAYAAAGFAIAAMGVGLWLSHAWPGTREAVVLGAAWVAAMVVTVYLADRMARSLYRREVARVRQLHRIRRMSSHLRQQQDALLHTEKLAAMGRVAAGIAHEITNPLASMDSVLQLMQRHPGGTGPESIAALREQIQRIHRTVRQLTAYAHPGPGWQESVAMEDVVRAALDVLAFNRRLELVAFESTIDPALGSVRVNPQALQQVLTNLIINALDATSETPAPRIGVHARRDGAECVIEVSDNGVGIEPENLPRIFEPFFTTKPVGQGTGLGLPICARLVREQEGTIGVASQPGRGTTFTIRIPAPVHESVRPSGAGVPRAAAAGQGSSS